MTVIPSWVRRKFYSVMPVLLKKRRREIEALNFDHFCSIVVTKRCQTVTAQPTERFEISSGAEQRVFYNHFRTRTSEGQFVSYLSPGFFDGPGVQDQEILNDMDATIKRAYYLLGTIRHRAEQSSWQVVTLFREPDDPKWQRYRRVGVIH